MNATLGLYRRFAGSAFGRWLFSRLVAFKAPYFASIAPVMDVLEPGRAVARIRHRRRVQNHLGTVHAIACCNLAEFVGGLGTEVSIPPSMRWIPKGMTVSYLAKAKGTLTATALVPAVREGEAQDIVVPVDVKDAAGTVVVHADITMYVSPKR